MLVRWTRAYAHIHASIGDNARVKLHTNYQWPIVKMNVLAISAYDKDKKKIFFRIIYACFSLIEIWFMAISSIMDTVRTCAFWDEKISAVGLPISDGTQ